MSNYPRIALFADTYHEINGAANVLRRLTDFAREHNRPFLCIRAGSRKTSIRRERNLVILELKRSPVSIPIDGDLKYDPLLWRYKNLVWRVLSAFKVQVLHLTGLNDVSQLGFYFAHFKSLPAVASWHTNVHEYTARRLRNLFPLLPAGTRVKLDSAVERAVLHGTMKLNTLAQVQLAPNEELVGQLEAMTNRPAYLMSRGVDTELFNPEKRRRGVADKELVLGFVGRLRVEKNVRFLAELDEKLRRAGIKNYKFVIVGEGSERDWLQKNLPEAVLTGILKDEALAQAYADMDLFVFPSKTDAFGNVVLEALASGVPPVVMSAGGPKFLIENDVNGFVAETDADFIGQVIDFAQERELRTEMKNAACAAACERSWESVFESLYKNYDFTAHAGKGVRLPLVTA